MFSGIIENIGTVKEYKKLKDYRLVLDTDLNFKDVKKGSSVCCNGVCLTVTSKKKLSKKTRLSFDVSKETVNCTNFNHCLLYTSPSPRDRTRSRMPSSA